MDDQLATQLATAMTGTTTTTVLSADETTATAAFTVKERFGLVTVEGTIPVVAATVSVDADGLPRGTAVLDVTRFDTGNARRDKDVRGSRFFDTASSPRVDFRSVSTRRTRNGVVVDGVLTIRGQESPLSLVTTLTPQANGRMAVHATGTFDRMGSALRKAPRWLVGSEVHVVVDAVLQPAPHAR
jgi:polyisoprenoid-binding protein YceI